MMNRAAGLLVVLFGASMIAPKGGAATVASKKGCDSAKMVRVLFIGNSLTYGHNVPRMVEEMAASLPGPCKARSFQGRARPRFIR